MPISQPEEVKAKEVMPISQPEEVKPNKVKLMDQSDDGKAEGPLSMYAGFDCSP